MATGISERLKDRLTQLNSNVRNFYRMAYNPEKYGWKKLDSELRYIEEHIAGAIIYDLFGDTDGHKKQCQLNTDGSIKTDDSTGKDKLIFGKTLIDAAINAVKERTDPTPSMIIDWMEADIQTHNPNSHGTDITDQEREADGKSAVLASLPALINFLSVDSQAFSLFTNEVKEHFKRMGVFVNDAYKLITEQYRDNVISSKIVKSLENAFNGEFFPEVGEYYYFLILPETITDDFIKSLMPLMSMRWTGVIDFGFETGNLFSRWLELNGEAVQNVNVKESVDKQLTNWIFLNGRNPSGTAKEIRALFNKIRNKPLPDKNLIVIDLCEDKTKTKKALERIWDIVSGDEPDLSTVIFSCKENGSNDIKSLIEGEGYTPAKIETIEVSAIDFISVAVGNRMFPGPIVSGYQSMPIEWASYIASGIKSLDSDNNGPDQNSRDGFYAGRVISVKELANGDDVFPRGNKSQFKRFYAEIENALTETDSKDFRIIQEPGAGGTTVSRRIAYDLRENHKEFSPLETEEFNILSFLKSHRSRQLRPIIISLMSAHDRGKITDKDYLSMMRFIQTFYVCFSIVTGETSNRLTDIIDKSAPAIEADCKPEMIANLKKSLKDSLPDLDSFIKIFSQLGYSNHNKAYRDSSKRLKSTAVLNLVECQVNPEVIHGSATIEHLRPDSDGGTNWCIGNLTLLDSKSNGALKDKPLKEKIPYYKKSGYAITRNFAERYSEGDFDPMKRAAYMAKLIYSCFLKV